MSPEKYYLPFKIENISLRSILKIMISAENEYGIYKKSKYNIIKKELESASVIINRWIENYKRKSNETLYFGYGASATSTVLLRFLKIS